MFVRRFRDARSKDLETLPSPLAFAKTARRRHHDPYSQRNLCALGVVLGVESSVRGGPAVTSEDAKLAKLAKAGETAAYERLVRNHQTAAFRTAYLITGDASEAEDAAQEAFVKAYRALGRFQTGAPLRPWLLAVVANEAKNRRKAALRRANLALRAGMESTGGTPHPP
jgi:hypothetical protein